MEEEVYNVFDRLKIPYEVIRHNAIYKSSDRGNLEIDFRGAVCCKNLFLKDEKNGKKYLVSLKLSKRANLKLLQSELGSNRLTFASDTELFENLGIKSGNASILNIICKPNTSVLFVIDKELLNFDKVCFHPNVNTASISFSPNYVCDILESYKANYIFLDV